MAELRNSAMVDFLVTVFSGEKAVSRLLSDIIKNRTNSLFIETLGLPSDFALPFFLEEDTDSVSFKMKLELGDKYQATILGKPCTNHLLQSGDYIAFSDGKVGYEFKMLFIATSDIRLGYKKFRLSRDTNVFIGRTPNNDISYSFSDYISREKHFAIRVDANGTAYVEDLKRSIGIYVNGNLIHSFKLSLFDEIYAMGLSIVYFGDWIAIRDLMCDTNLAQIDYVEVKSTFGDGKAKPYFVNTPRILKSLDRDELEVDGPPNPPSIDKTPALLVLGPSVTMSMVMLASLGVSISSAISGGNIPTLIASGTMAVGMLLGSLMWPSLLRSYQKRSALADEKYRKARYTSYIAEIEKRIIAKANRTNRLLNEVLCPTPDIICSFLENETNRLHLWERSYDDDDFLAIRMGVGDRPFDVQIKIPRQGFQLYDDDLRDLPDQLVNKYSVLSNAPLTLDLYNNHTIGIIGSSLNIQHILSEIILNIASLHSYEETKIVVVTSPMRASKFESIRNIPHIWSNDKKIRFFATTSEEVHYIFNYLNEIMIERDSKEVKENKAIPHYILILTEPSLVEKEALLRYINDANNSVGLTTVFAYGDITKLPKSCKAIIQSDDTLTGYYIKNQNRNKFITFSLDNIDECKMQLFFSELSRLNVKRDVRSMGIVDRISFLQMYKAGNVDELKIEQHWDSNNSAKSLAAPIGVMAGGEVFSLDIHEAYHGCHGLVAGTTGSGKSEFLQAFILSLAINYSPKEISFVLVDFKGGDMARPFMAKPFSPALPHLAATISNLSGNILYRALVSLEAEIKSRQRIFNESAIALGVDKLDINSYHKYYKGGRLSTPLPHLVIIIDEFAQLKTQQPEFLTQLINVAQVGRSLGIHLILATQKPSGIVDPQIMSNSRFKVCLKVAEKQDSIDMINKPDSAFIKNPGRLNIQVGYDEIYECVQSGYSGADYIPTKKYCPDEEITVQMTDNTANPIHSGRIDLSSNKSDKTQLEAVVAEIVALGQKKNLKVKPLWLEVLPDKVLLNTLRKGNRGLCTATIGLIDFVQTQEQKPLTIDLVQSGHLALYGASGTGKTTFLQSMIYSMVCDYEYTPDELTIYAMDFGGRNLGYIDNLPHTGGVAYSDEEGKIVEIISVLHSILDERKRLFASHGCGTFSDYRALQINSLPAVLLLIDNFSSFRDKYMDLSDSLISIISAGKTYGIYFVITGNTRNSIYYKITEHISTYFCLKMNDPNSYMDILNIRPPVVPEEISGRGITVINREVVEFQTALAVDGDVESDRTMAITQKYFQLGKSWTGYRPIRLAGDGVMSKEGSSESLSANYTSGRSTNPPESISDSFENFVLGTSKSGVLHYGLDLALEYKLCVCANCLEDLGDYYIEVLNEIAKYSSRRAIFIDNDDEYFITMVSHYSECKYVKSITELDEVIQELRPELNSRIENKGSNSEQLFIIVGEYNRFFDMITDNQAAFMRKVLQHIDSPEYGISFICGLDVNGIKSNDRLFLSLIVNAENYVICQNCYNTAVSKIESLPLIPEIKSTARYLCLKEKSVEVR